MARTNTLGNFLTDVANAIREKKGTTDTILASNFDTEIASIESGVDINEYLSDTITNGSDSLGGWTKTVKKMRSPLTVKGTDAQYMFNRYPLNELPQLDTSNVTNMSYMFYNCYYLTTIPQLNTSNVTNMSRMFYSCYGLTTIPQLDTSNVTNMSDMFNSCNKLTTIPQLNTSNVANMSDMFSGCNKLTTILQLNGEKLININYVFRSCSSLENFNGLINLGQAYSTTTSANYGNYRLDLSDSKSLTEQSLINILNNLYDIATKGCKTQTVTLGATNLAKLTSTEGQQALASAQSNGWNIN